MRRRHRSSPSGCAWHQRFRNGWGKNLGDGVIDLCNVKIGLALIGYFEGFERRFGFCDYAGRRRHRWIVLMAATGSRGRRLY